MSTSAPTYAWTPERLLHYPLLTEADLSPDGRTIVYALQEPVLTDEESKFIAHLYLVAVESGQGLRLTYGRSNNTMPRWSPDGRMIAFLSDRQGGKPNLYVLRVDGGEAWPLTEAEKGIGRFAWSPDGTRLAFSMVPPDSAEVKAAHKAKNDVTRCDVDLERAALWVAPLAPGGGKLPEPRILTDAARHVTSFDWTDDGAALAFTYQPHPSDDYWPETRLAVVAADAPAAAAGERPAIRELGRTAAGNLCLVHGDWVACVTALEPVSWAGRDRIVLYPLAGGEPRPLALTEEALPTPVAWSGDGRMLYIQEPSGTATALRALPIDGGAPQTLLDGAGLFQARANRRDTLVLITQDLERPNALALWRAGDSQWREVFCPPLPTDWPVDKVPHSEVIRWLAPDGLEIEGILTYPLGYVAGQRYPTLVIVHGGPAGVFSRSYSGALNRYPVASFAERGYLLLRVNPRGSSGYGATFRAANRKDWGGGDYRDIMSGVDALIARGLADPQRLGIMGWSYGGYMTSWVITQTTRFRAASVGAGVTDLVSMTGTSDITGFLPDYLASEAWDNLEIYGQHSPMFHMKGVSTPTLIQHGRDDLRVPLGQGQELYNALKRQGVTVEMILYPRSGHAVTEPRLLLDVIQRNLDWFDRWLK